MGTFWNSRVKDILEQIYGIFLHIIFLALATGAFLGVYNL